MDSEKELKLQEILSEIPEHESKGGVDDKKVIEILAEDSIRRKSKPDSSHEILAIAESKEYPKENFEFRDERKSEDKNLNKTLNILRILAFSVVFISASAFLIFAKRPTVSNEENRTLARFPKFSIESYFDGDYSSGIESFFDDTVPHRSFFKSKIAEMKAYFGIKSDDKAVLVGSGMKSDGDISEKSSVEEKATSISEIAKHTKTSETIETKTSTTKQTDKNEEVHGEISNNILIVNKRAIMLFGGSRENSDKYANAVNNYKKSLGSKINVYSMVIPTAVSFYMPQSYKDLTNDENEYIDYINSKLDSDIKPVNVFDSLNSHKDEDIYAKTDHHWLPLGAYYAANDFANSADVPFAPLSSYKKRTRNDYVGTMYGYSGSDIIKNNPESFTYYIPQNSYETTYFNNDLSNPRNGKLLLDISKLEPVSYYLVFMGGDDRITHIQTDVKNGRNLVILKDSYGNAMVPAFTQSFENIYVVDLRYLNNINIIDFAKAVNCTDFLFAMDTYSATGGNVENLDRIYTQKTNIDISDRLNAAK